MTDRFEGFDYSLAGKRIRLIHTNDKYTKLREGDLGTVRFRYRNLDSINIAVQWDSGSTLDMIQGIDQYQIFEEKTVKHVIKATCTCVECGAHGDFDNKELGFELVIIGKTEENLCKNCYHKHCIWCLENQKGKNDVFTHLVDLSFDYVGRTPICKDCLKSVVAHRVESYADVDFSTPKNIEVNLSKSLEFEGLE